MKLATAFMMLAIPAALSAQQAIDPCAQAPATCATLIDTSATSETRIPNTAVDISVSVIANGKDMAEVQRTLATKSNSLLAYLRSQQVERLITSRVSFAPETRYDKNAPDKTVGYTGTSSVSFRTTPEKAADILAGVLTSGANQIESSNFTPTEKELTDARRKLSEEATRTAIEQADAIARAANMRVVAVRHINVNDESVPRPIPFRTGMTMEMKAAAPVPMQTSAGDQSLSVRVNITAAASH